MSPSNPTNPAGSIRYLRADGTLGASTTAGWLTLAAANGEHTGVPTNARTFTATGLRLRYSGGATAFDLGVDAGTGVGAGVEMRVSYDLTGNGSFDRVETYHYFATDPIPGDERYTQARGLLSASGALGDLVAGTVKVEVWNAIGRSPTTVTTGTSVVRLPFSS